MKKNVLILAVLAALVALVACSASKSTTETAQDGHPSLSEQDQLVSCASCHKEATPAIYNDWYNARHGLANVKCYQCHGTYENFAKAPGVESCQSCHADKMGDHRAGMQCVECHSAHSFAAN